jgi:hypothetical protein
MSEIEMSMSVPLDSEGFLRRECPTCEREFKWRPTPEGEESAPMPDAGPFCPYCAVQAPPDSWWTQAQIAAAHSQVYDEAVKPELEKFADSISQSSGGFLQVSAEITEPDKPPALTETDDMLRVDFDCHPSEPVKILDEWNEAVHCLVCGAPAASS